MPIFELFSEPTGLTIELDNGFLHQQMKSRSKCKRLCV